MIEKFKNNLSEMLGDLSFHDIIKISNAKVVSSDLSAMKVAVLSTSTIDNAVKYLDAICYLNNINLDCYIGPYNQIFQELSVKDSETYAFKPDVILIHCRLEDMRPNLCFSLNNLQTNELSRHVSEIFNEISSWVDLIQVNSKAVVFISTLPLTFGFLAPTLNMTGHYARTMIEDINNKLWTELGDNAVTVNYAECLSKIGYENSIDPKLWYLAKMTFNDRSASAWAHQHLPLFRDLLGKRKKCLVLDLDNTLWGGIVGEDGFDGISLSSDYPGSVFTDIQRIVKFLYDNGVMLAICSKNNEADVKEVFNKHKGMILDWEHFLVHKVNWVEKRDNIIDIANELNISLDSIVFVDDSPIECTKVMSSLPEVGVFQVPEDLTSYPSLFVKLCSYFAGLTATKEDRMRNQMYTDDKARMRSMKATSSIESFWKSLEMNATCFEISYEDMGRTAQLLLKTNQFNMTTKRYDKVALGDIIKSVNWDIYGISLSDKYGDNGQVGVIIIERKNSLARIDTFLLSCRVLGRNLEREVMCYVTKKLVKQGISSIIGSYKESSKNQPARDFYAKLGFVFKSELADGVKEFESTCSNILKQNNSTYINFNTEVFND